MPTYNHSRRKYHGRNRYQILTALSRENTGRDKLEKIFLKIIGPVFPFRPTDTALTAAKNNIVLTLNKQQKLRFYQLLYELKRDGLVITEKDDYELLYGIAPAGIRWLKSFKRAVHPIPPSYPKSVLPHTAVTIVSYDIPEHIRYLRNWLRDTLKNCGLKLMQRSVWIGKVRLPEQFLKDIIIFDLEKYVEIFEITKTGTLRHRI